MAPPTGTRKFLSVDCTTASTLPTVHALLIFLHITRLCTPYALLITCPVFVFSHNLATASTSSLARGAKQLVDVTTHTSRSPNRAISRSIASTSVMSSSPHKRGSMTTIFNPAHVAALTHVFWSNRHHITESLSRAFAQDARIDMSTIVNVIPVAIGSTHTSRPMSAMPEMRMASRDIIAAARAKSELPHALGCSAMTSPERPMPCAR
mmetsp:Transcript_4082/g.14881  ORF Transcript_4082/g.14881 Transcript_4082/m.14881 type:complete len:208 (+) Transcript_4082:2440-3063(+)